MTRPKNGMPPIHPGEILLEDYLKPMDMSANALALALGVPTNRVTQIINGERGITADTALRLARAYDTGPEFWLNLQNFFDLEVTRRSGKISEIERQVHPAPAPVS